MEVKVFKLKEAEPETLWRSLFMSFQGVGDNDSPQFPIISCFNWLFNSLFILSKHTTGLSLSQCWTNHLTFCLDSLRCAQEKKTGKHPPYAYKETVSGAFTQRFTCMILLGTTRTTFLTIEYRAGSSILTLCTFSYHPSLHQDTRPTSNSSASGFNYCLMGDLETLRWAVRTPSTGMYRNYLQF